MSNEYVERNVVALAMQLKEDNVGDIISWLTHLGIQHSYDEIKSAGQLIVYNRGGAPAIVGLGWWIVYHYDNISVMDDLTFKRHFEPRSV